MTTDEHDDDATDPATSTGLPAGRRASIFGSASDIDADCRALWAVADAACAADGEHERDSLEAHRPPIVPDDLERRRSGPGRRHRRGRRAGVVGVARVERLVRDDVPIVRGASGVVHPAVRRRGLGTVLLGWTERRRANRRRERGRRARPTDRVRALETFAEDGDLGAPRAAATAPGSSPSASSS